MKRTTLIGALAGVAVLLVGCGSKSGTAAPASTTSSSVASASEPSSSAPSSSAPSSSAPSSSEPVGSTPAGSPESSASASSGVADSVTEPSGTPSSAPATTVGDKSGGLDAQSTAWFTTFCDGVSPVLQISSSLSSGGASVTDEAGEKKIITLFGTLGTSLTTTASRLKALPPPTFSGGSAFAGKVVTAFGTAGPAISAEAKKLTADPSTFAGSMGGLTSSLTKAVQPLQDLGSLKLTPQTEAAIEAIPACKKVQALAGG